MILSTQELREKMTKELASMGIEDDKVLQAMSKIPREAFLPRAFYNKAYHNEALPIGENQTISQPYVVAKMTEALEIRQTNKILEIGTGSGYQTSVLCKMVRRVFTIERFASLSKEASERLDKLNVHNYVAKVGDGTLGWSEQAPFDRIIVTAASPKVPQSLLNQLNIHGILVIPVGKEQGVQKLMRYGKRDDGSIVEEYLCDVRFVPLVGQEGVIMKKAL
jgi:protein-L-isoaspartate(D-aspartate) O-methyltransferase